MDYELQEERKRIPHHAELLDIGDRCICNIRHKTDGSKNINNALSGEWGGNKVRCLKYYTSDALISGEKLKVTCKNCLKKLR